LQSALSQHEEEDRTLLKRLLPLSLLASAIVGPAWGDCTLSDATVKYPKTEQAITAFGSDRETVVSDAVKASLLQDMCTSGEKISVEKNLAIADIDSLGETAVAEYLDRQLDRQKEKLSISTILRSRLGAQGFSRKALKRVVAVSVESSKQFDSIEVEHQRFPRDKYILLPVGKVSIKTLNGTELVCAEQSVDVTPEITSITVCR
jgi:hypothetical protein